MNRVTQLFRPPRLCFLLARLAWSLLALAVPFALLACWGFTPAAFLFWSYLALPLAVITVIWTWRLRFPDYRRSVYLVFAVWLLLLAGFGAMALAGDNIRWSPMLHWTIQIVYGVAMFGVVAVAFLYVWKAERYAV